MRSKSRTTRTSQPTLPQLEADADGLYRGLDIEDFVVDAAADRRPIHMVTAVAVARKRNPWRMRRLMKDIRWVEQVARECGVLDPPTPEWLRRQ